MYTEETKQLLTQLLTKEEVLDLVDSLAPAVALERLQKATVVAADANAAETIAKVTSAIEDVKGQIPADVPAPGAPETADAPHEQHVFTNNAETCDIEGCDAPNQNTTPEEV